MSPKEFGQQAAYPQPILDNQGRTDFAHQYGCGGIDIRVYLAAHAPHNVPEWFKASVPEIPKKPEGAEYCKTCKTDTGDCENTASCRAAHQHREQENEWRENKKRQTLLQWPLFWADSQLEQLAKEQA